MGGSGGGGGGGLPGVVQEPVSAAVRTGLASLCVCGIDSVSGFGEGVGGLFARSPLNRRRRGETITRLTFAFPHWSGEQVERCADQMWRHLGRLCTEVVMQPRLALADSWQTHLRFESTFPGLDDVLAGRPAVCVTAHLGNWELVGAACSRLGFPLHALYRPLDLAPMDRWLRGVRGRSGMRIVDKFGAMRRLPAMVDAGAIPVFVIDQNAGDRGEYVPFFGRLTSSHRSLAAFLMQRDAVAVIGAALRLPEPWNLGVDPLHDAAVGRPPDRLHYRCVMTSAIRPEDFKDHPDPAFYITARWRREIEALVRLAPEQYFWMHRVWKSRPEFEINGTGLPGELRDKLQSLPWMTGDEIDRLAEQSARDAAELTRRRSRRLE